MLGVYGSHIGGNACHSNTPTPGYSPTAHSSYTKDSRSYGPSSPGYQPVRHSVLRDAAIHDTLAVMRSGEPVAVMLSWGEYLSLLLGFPCIHKEDPPLKGPWDGSYHKNLQEAEMASKRSSGVMGRLAAVLRYSRRFVGQSARNENLRTRLQHKAKKRSAS